MRKKLIVALAAVCALLGAFLAYTGIYYRADDTALAALQSDGAVQVAREDWGWLFDGPAAEPALIFYPGAKVEATAYAPMLRLLAARGMDVCLVEMPFRLAIFGVNAADGVMRQCAHERWYVGGHSLGGAMAADYAARHGDALEGLVLFGAYPARPLPDGIALLSLRGSEDGVLNPAKLEKGWDYAPEATVEKVIEGGNHAQFGNYGAQKGDGEAAIPAAAQQDMAVDFIMENVAQPPR